MRKEYGHGSKIKKKILLQVITFPLYSCIDYSIYSYCFENSSYLYARIEWYNLFHLMLFHTRTFLMPLLHSFDR